MGGECRDATPTKKRARNSGSVILPSLCALEDRQRVKRLYAYGSGYEDGTV